MREEGSARDSGDARVSPTAKGERTMRDALDEMANEAATVQSLAAEGFVMSYQWWKALRDAIRAQERLLREIAPSP